MNITITTAFNGWIVNVNYAYQMDNLPRIFTDYNTMQEYIKSVANPEPIVLKDEMLMKSDPREYLGASGCCQHE